MTVTKHTLTGDIGSLVGGVFTDDRGTNQKVAAWLETNLAGDALVDTLSNVVMLGSLPLTLSTDLTFSQDGLIATNSTGVNPTGVQYRAHVSYVDLGLGRRVEWVSNWFDLTADVDLADVVAAVATPPNYQSTFLAAAQALLDAQIDLSSIDDSDAEVATLISNGTFGPLTRAALSASIALVGSPLFVAEGSAFADIGKQAGVDNTGATECAAAVNTALAACASLGVRAYAKGTFKLGSSVTITGNADLGDATFTGDATPLVKVGDGTTTLTRKAIVLPRVVRLTKNWGVAPGPGAGVVNTDVGVRVNNSRTCTVTFPYVQNFSVGIDIADDAGSLYNRYFIGHLENNAINLRAATSGAGGAANECQFHGGRYSHNSGEGSNVAGTRHIALLTGSSSGPNNMEFFGGSVEGNTAEYHVVCQGSYNQFIGLRWEATTPKVLFDSSVAHNNVIRGGYNAESIVVSQTNSAARNELDAPGATQRLARSGGANGAIIGQNLSSSDQPLLLGLDVTGDPYGTGGTAPSSTYCFTLTAQHLRGKQTADVNPRVDVDFVNGKIGFGSGPSAITQFLRQETSTQLGFQGTGFCAATDATYDIGQSGAKRFRDLFLSRNADAGGWVRALVHRDLRVTPTFAGVQTVDFTTGALAILTMTANITSLTFAGGVTDGIFEIHFVQDATGSRTLAGVAAAIKWAGGAPTLSTGASKRDIFRFRYDGSNWLEIGRSMNVG